MKLRRRTQRVALAMVAGLVGCYSGSPAMTADEGGTDTATGGETDGNDDGVPDDVNPFSVAPPLVGRLTETQYENSVLDILGVALTDEEREQLPRDIPIEGDYSTAVASQFFNTQYVLAYAFVARSLTERLEADALTQTHGGCVGVGDTSCRQSFIRGLGLRLARRPLDDDEVAHYEELAETITSEPGTTEDDVVAAIVQAMLQSPQFLYRLEVETDGTPDEIRLVSGYELASRLSYFLWQSAPDLELLEFAAQAGGDGSVDTTGIEAQVQRMIADPRFTRSREVFWADYSLVSIASLLAVEPEVADELVTSLMATFEHISGDDPEHSLASLFDGEQLVMTPAVAELAGVSDPKPGLSLYDSSTLQARGGVLTHPGFLAALGTTSFVGRGVFMTERLLCQHLTPPPDDVAEQIMQTAQQTESMTPREASEFRMNIEPQCTSCHTLFEPIAYGFERFDLVGRYTTNDAEGRALFSDGSLPAFGDRQAVTFSSASDLLGQLAGEPQVQRCLVENMMEYASGTRASAAVDSIEQATEEFVAADETFAGLAMSVAQNRQLTCKRTAPAE